MRKHLLVHTSSLSSCLVAPPHGRGLVFILPSPTHLGCLWLSFDLVLGLTCLLLARNVTQSPRMSQIDPIPVLLRRARMCYTLVARACAIVAFLTNSDCRDGVCRWKDNRLVAIIS